MPVNMALRRILLRKKDRQKRSVHIEEDLYQVIKQHNLSLSDITNVAIERFLRDQGLIK